MQITIAEEETPLKQISCAELEEALANGQSYSIVDVREAYELSSGMIPGAKHIPMNALMARRNELDKNQVQVLVCASGARSGMGSFMLRRFGYKALNLIGGMDAWTGDVE